MILEMITNMFTRPTIAIIGAAGFLGGKILQNLSSQYNMIGADIVQRPYLEQLDITSPSQVQLFWKKYSPDIVVLCAGITRAELCEQNKNLAYRVNVEGVKHILQHIQHTPSKIIYFSTDFVFSGKQGNYSENDAPNPINYYGLTKLKAEELIRDQGENHVILRLGFIYGYNRNNNDFLASLTAEPTIRCGIDAIRSPTLIDDVTRHLPYFFERSGLYHLSGPEIMSRYELARIAIEILELKTILVPVTSDEIYVISRPKDCSLRSVRHNLDMMGPKEGLLILKRQMEEDSHAIELYAS